MIETPRQATTRRYREKNREALKEYSRKYYQENKDKHNAVVKANYEKHHKLKRQLAHQADPRVSMWKAAKQRSRKKNLVFDIEIDDIIVPEVCPVFGTPFSFGIGRACSTSPTLDRKDSTKGYVKDNVQVISWRANDLKKDATIEELQAIVEYMRS